MGSLRIAIFFSICRIEVQLGVLQFTRQHGDICLASSFRSKIESPVLIMVGLNLLSLKFLLFQNHIHPMRSGSLSNLDLYVLLHGSLMGTSWFSCL